LARGANPYLKSKGTLIALSKKTAFISVPIKFGSLGIAVMLREYTDYTDYAEKNGFSHGKSVYPSEIRQIRVQKDFNHGNSRRPTKFGGIMFL
jgi:hypothetical protein